MDTSKIHAQRSIEKGSQDSQSMLGRGARQQTDGPQTSTKLLHASDDTESPQQLSEPVQGRLPLPTDSRALFAHLFYIFDRHPVVRPGVKEFLAKIAAYKAKGEVKRVYIYTANTSLHWVRFIMQSILVYYSLDLSIIDGIKHAPGGLKVVPEGAVLYDDHPENSIGLCIKVEPYTNEVPWELLEPILQTLPDHDAILCPCWEQCGGLQAFIDRDKSCKDRDHDHASEDVLRHLTENFVPFEEVLLDMDETLIAGARVSAYYNALNHFFQFRGGTEELETRSAEPASA